MALLENDTMTQIVKRPSSSAAPDPTRFPRAETDTSAPRNTLMAYRLKSSALESTLTRDVSSTLLHHVISFHHLCHFSPWLQILKTKDLSPEHNYLMGVHPHGILTFGAFCNFCTEATGFSKIFPGITPHLATLSWFFKIPLIREYIMAKGVCSVSEPTIDYLLSHGPGNLVGIVVGGVAEALQSVPNTTTLLLRKHKGFVRIALQRGAHLVPTFTFGENEVYDQVLFHKDSRTYKFQSYFRRTFGFYFCIFYGRGFSRDSNGLLPYPLPIVTVVGEPLPLPKIENPSQEMVDKYHTLYMDALCKLFDQHKTQHGCSETQKLIFL
ncbi:Acyl-CoA wax alcohol acyltransferase 1 [Pteropus alecto]|uniref:Acyltransferase n=1 Tax=Pteropus alecto TaxID=9402 RepID=L5KXB9_PTEAL|nr:Acyl-CoA wax alcohol acyltransferase 1 [Pteropus alecto]